MTYETIETPHFDIHFQDGLDHTARMAAAIGEELFEELTILFRWKVEKRIQVIITDADDSANGSASVRGRPMIHLRAAAPELEGALASHDYWLRALFLHELVHIVHLSIHGKTSDVINSIFGDVYLPNQMLPRAIVEGLAVLLETHGTSAGRIRSPFYQMYVRTAALEGTLLDLAQVSNDTRQYLRGHHAYIYGAMFMEYLYQQYGMDKIIAFCHDYGSSVLPYGINRAFLDTFGKDVLTLYKEWVGVTVAQSRARMAVLAEAGLTASTRLTFDGENKGKPIFDRNGEAVLLPMATGWVERGTYRVPLSGGEPEPLFRSDGNSNLSMDRNGTIFYNRVAPYRNIYYFNDLFTVDRDTLSPRRLTHGLRALYAAVSPKGDRVALVVNDDGTSDLRLADERGNILKTLVHSEPDDQVYDPEFSPDGRWIAATLRVGTRVDLALIDAETGAYRYLTDDRFLEIDPSFDSTGRYLLFCSDRTGIYNIYAYDLQENRFLQVTNVLTGAFHPAVSPDGEQLAFIKYSSIGWDLHVMPLDLEAAVPVPFPTVHITDVPPLPPPSSLPISDYNPLPTMLPTYWLLNAKFDVDWNATLQAATAFSDITGRHQAGLEVTYDIENQDVSGRVGYSYQGIVPDVRLAFSRQYTPQAEGYVYEGEHREWTQIVTRGSLSLGFPVPGVDERHGLHATYSVVHVRPREQLRLTLDPRGALPDVPVAYFRAGIQFGWRYANLVSSPLGIGAHQGRSLSTDIEINHPTIGGTQTLATFRYHWNEYVGMPWLEHHTLVVGINGGVHLSDPPDRWSFAVGGYNPQNIVDTILNNTGAGAASLRGYSPGAFRGSRYHSLKLDYRFPIWFSELGYGTLPFYLRRVQASIFSDNALISYDELDRDDWKSSVGAQISIHFSIGYYQYMSLKLGYARGLMSEGINEVILVISGGG